MPWGEGIRGKGGAREDIILDPFLLSRMKLLFVLLATALLVHADPVSYSIIITFINSIACSQFSGSRCLIVLFFHRQPTKITSHFHKALIRCI